MRQPRRHHRRRHTIDDPQPSDTHDIGRGLEGEEDRDLPRCRLDVTRQQSRRQLPARTLDLLREALEAVQATRRRRSMRHEGSGSLAAHQEAVLHEGVDGLAHRQRATP